MELRPITAADTLHTVRTFRAELRARFGADWKRRPFWLTTDEPPRFSDNGISLYIWRVSIADTRTYPDEAQP